MPADGRRARGPSTLAERTIASYAAHPCLREWFDEAIIRPGHTQHMSLLLLSAP